LPFWLTYEAIFNNNNNNNNNNNMLIINVPVAIETGGTWHHQAAELVEEIGRRTANITGDAT